MTNIAEISQNAKRTSKILAGIDSKIKDEALLNISRKIEENLDLIFEENKKDMEFAKVFVQRGEITQSSYNRLKLDENKARDMVQGIKDVIKLPDPVNKVLWKKELDENLVLTKITCPIGVIGVIFEARPDVMAQVASLAIKSSNCVILKGGRESINTNNIIFKLISEALSQTEGFPNGVINLIHSREEVYQMLQFNKYIDLIIPRGSNQLVKYIQENTKIPVLGHASGICHIFLDKSGDYNKAKRIIVDAKTQYPSACNSIETLLIHKDFSHIEELKKELIKNNIKLVENPENWSIEYGDKILNIKIVSSVDEAIEHINKYSSGHTDSIITEDKENAKKFLANVDSAGVYHNVSTRFADGFRYGFGAEVGISTNKTHARGPVGLEGLTIYKYLLEGNGEIVSDYAEGRKKFNHRFI